eukprot:TRINITY_DN58891_c0_g1_i1.p2 TRINITY_DN58891_c0_g1~~TRINITY_DN58891_c0_g1_i1.p2  ORF type:complete len:102 (+),score=7.82 TRINITY_DN58891_c0_g1_i1:308-613(+)
MYESRTCAKRLPPGLKRHHWAQSIVRKRYDPNIEHVEAPPKCRRCDDALQPGRRTPHLVAPLAPCPSIPPSPRVSNRRCVDCLPLTQQSNHPASKIAMKEL